MESAHRRIATDLQEALMKAGLDHLDEVEEHLEEWGYGMTFEE